MLEIRGLFDVMNSLIDIPKVIMALTRKGKSSRLPRRCERILLHILRQLKKQAVHSLCIAMLPQASSYRTEIFQESGGVITIPLIKEWMEVMGDQCVLQVCPKTSFLLTGLDMAEWKYKTTDKDKTYFEAYLSDPEIRLTGQRCSREISHSSGGRINYLELV